MSVPTDYLAYLKLRSDANDETGTYNGTNNGAVFNGSSAEFDGTDSIDLPTLSLSTWGGFGLCIWTKKGVGIDEIIGSYSTVLSTQYTILRADDTTLYFYPNHNSTSYAYANVTIDWTVSNHITINRTGNGNAVTLYLNSVALTTLYSGTLGNGDTIITRIGGDTDTPMSGLTGEVHDFRSYNNSFTALEIEDIYNEEKPFVTELFSDISEDLFFEAFSSFEDVSVCHSGYFYQLSDISINQGNLSFYRFYDVSIDTENPRSTIIQRVNT